MVVVDDEKTGEDKIANISLHHPSIIDNHVEAIWRLDFEKPIPLHLPAAEQVDWLYRYGYMADGNSAFARHYGFESPGEIAGFRLEELLPRDLPTSFPTLMQAVNAKYQLNGLETIEHDRLGNKKIFLNNFIGEIEDGKLLRIWGTSKDITRQRQLEDEAHIHSALVEQIPEGCVIVESQTDKIVYTNIAFTSITGYTASDMVDVSNKKLSFLQGKDSDSNTVAKITEAIAQERSFQGDILSYKKNGTPFWSDTRISPIKDANGVMTHYVAILADITKGRDKEAELQNQRDELTHLGRVSAMGELAAALAHELNQPLTAILSNAQAAQRFLQQENPDLDELREILNDIVADDKRAGALMHRIRHLVKKRDTSKFEQVDINNVITEVCKLISNDLAIKHTRLHTELAQNLPTVQGDPVQLQQVMLNLVINACHAMRDLDTGERLITITTQKLDDSSIKVTVIDSGQGIDAKVQKNIFMPFYTTKEDGMGMGLAINRRIIESHGGNISAENNPDQGATFYLTLPVAEKEIVI